MFLDENCELQSINIYIERVLYFINDPMFSDLISSLGLVAKKSGIITAVYRCNEGFEGFHRKIRF